MAHRRRDLDGGARAGPRRSSCRTPPTLADLRDAVLAAGTVTVCGQCAARRDLTEADLVPGVVIRGAAAFVEEVTAEGAQALVY